MNKITILVPVYNEKNSLLEIIKRIEEVDFGQVKKYLSLFPDRVYRNIYQAGLMNELV